MADDLTLYASSSWDSPWVFHAMIALEEKRLAYQLEVVSMPMSTHDKQLLVDKALLGTVPVLRHGDAWLAESLAISEYLAETFPTPAHPRLFPADLVERGRARQVMSWLRTSLAALRDARPTSLFFGRYAVKPMTDKAKADAATLIRVASALVAPGKTTLFDAWCIADIDLALALMRLIAAEDPVPAPLVEYALAQWDRKSVRKYMAHLPTSH